MSRIQIYLQHYVNFVICPCKESIKWHIVLFLFNKFKSKIKDQVYIQWEGNNAVMA